MPRDIHARRAPGAEQEIPAGLVPDRVVLPEHAADLSQEELERLVRAMNARNVAAALPDDHNGMGTRR